MSKLIVSTFFCAVVLILSASDTFACSCIPPKPIEDEYKQRFAVFSGKIVSIKTGEYLRKVRVRVEKSWKGNSPKTVTISTATAGSMCGYSFAVGKRYLIYANGENINDLSASICSRTKLLSESKEDVEALNGFATKDDSKN